MSINKKVALHATQNLLMVLGGTVSIAFAATLQWWLLIGGAGMVTLTWIMLYKFELGIIEHFTEGKKNENNSAPYKMSRLQKDSTVH